MNCSRLALVVCVLSLCARGASAHAQQTGTLESDAVEASALIEAARALFIEATALARRGAWAEASARFTRSHALRPHAVTAYNIAYCELERGHLSQARELFVAATGVFSSDGMHELPEEMRAAAQRHVAGIDRELERISTATAASAVFAPAVPVPVPVPPPMRAAREDTPPSAVRVASYVSLGTSGAALLLGATSAMVAAMQASELHKQCPDGVCNEENADDLQRARTFADVATFAFIGAAVAGATGGVLWLSSDGPSASDATAHGLRLAPWVGLGAAGWEGRF